MARWHGQVKLAVVDTGLMTEKNLACGNWACSATEPGSQIPPGFMSCGL